MGLPFETLVYTDCRPGQGLRGTAGLQFQARSSDAVAAAETPVKDHLLYEPPSRWMAERRPVDAYPRSFAHMAAGGYLATARGLYLGREMNGTREGNQLTHAIVTTDADAYGTLRPAQLFASGFWSERPIETTRSAPVTVDANGCVYTPARAREFVLAQPNGREWLTRLVSALETAGRPPSPRVLFVGDDVPAIVEWLVAGTLLVSPARALQLGFKIFSNDPSRCAQPIIAVHPEFAGESARVGNQLGYAVFDLRTLDSTPVAPTEAAEQWVGLFLDGDPRDAVDALAVAGESGLDRDDPRAAAALGMAVILHRQPDPAHAEAIVGWLRTAPTPLRAAYGADLAELFATVPDRWSRRVLELLDAVGADGLLPGQAAEVRIALLFKDIEAAVVDQEVSPDHPAPLPPAEWDEGRAGQVHDVLRDAIHLEGRTGAEIEALLRVAWRYECDLGLSADDPATAELARYVADRPTRLVPPAWPPRTEIEPALLAELTARVERGEIEPELVGDKWAKWLARRASRLAPPLRAAMLGARVRHDDGRAELVARELDDARTDPERFIWTAEALFSQAAPTRAELSRLAELAPPGVTPLPGLVRALVADVTGRDPLIADDLRLCLALIQAGLLEPTRPLERLLVQHKTLTDHLRVLRSTPNGAVEDSLHELTGVDGRLIRMLLGAVALALAESAGFRRVGTLLDGHPDLTEPYVNALRQRLHDSDRPEPAVAAYYLANTRFAKDRKHRAALDRAVGQWFVRVPDARITAVARTFRELGPQWRDLWEDYAHASGGRRRRYRLAHPFGGR